MAPFLFLFLEDFLGEFSEVHFEKDNRNDYRQDDRQGNHQFWAQPFRKSAACPSSEECPADSNSEFAKEVRGEELDWTVFHQAQGNDYGFIRNWRGCSCKQKQCSPFLNFRSILIKTFTLLTL